MRNGIETKVAASTGASLAVTIAFAVIHWLDPQLAMPPAVIVGGLTTLVTLGAGYLAPHTHLRPQPPAVTWTAPTPASPPPPTTTTGAAS